MEQTDPPAKVASNVGLGPAPAFLHAGNGSEAHPAGKVAMWPEHNRARMKFVLYTGEQLDAAVADERERCARLVEPGTLGVWEARGGLEGLELMRDLAAAIRGPNVGAKA